MHRRYPRLALTTLALLAGTASPLFPLASAQQVGPQTQMTTISGAELNRMLDATTQTVILQARAQGASESDIAQLQQRLSGLLGQASQLVQGQSASGQIQIPTQALTLLGSNGGLSASQIGGMQAQGFTAQDFPGLPALPGFLGDGGLDTLIDYLISGLSTAVSMIPVIGPPLSTIIKQVAGSLKSFLINNALAGGVNNALSQAQQYYQQLQTLLGYADLNKLLGLGTKEVSNRLNSALGSYGATNVTANPNDPKEIQAAVEQAAQSTGAGYQAELSQMSKDPYMAATGYSKYTNPLTALGEMASMVGHYEAAELTNKNVRATGQSLTAQAVGDKIVEDSAKNVQTAMLQGQIARTGVASATTTLGAMTIQTGLMEQANNTNAMNAAAITAMLKQNLSAQDANMQVTSALLDNVIKERRENAAATQAAMKRMQESNITAAQQAAASVASLSNLSSLGTLDASAHPLPAPYGEQPFLK